MKNVFYKMCFGICGAFLAWWKPSSTYIFICILLLFWDCYEAYRLNIRVKKKYPQKSNGYFQSNKAWVVIGNVIKIFLAIILATAIEQNILKNTHIPLAQIVAGAICFIQTWSILENMSSCNGKAWAKVLQKIMVDKTSRHFDIDLSGFKTTETNGKSTDNGAAA